MKKLLLALAAIALSISGAISAGENTEVLVDLIPIEEMTPYQNDINQKALNILSVTRYNLGVIYTDGTPGAKSHDEIRKANAKYDSILRKIDVDEEIARSNGDDLTPEDFGKSRKLVAYYKLNLRRLARPADPASFDDALVNAQLVKLQTNLQAVNARAAAADADESKARITGDKRLALRVNANTQALRESVDPHAVLEGTYYAEAKMFSVRVPERVDSDGGLVFYPVDTDLNGMLVVNTSMFYDNLKSRVAEYNISGGYEYHLYQEDPIGPGVFYAIAEISIDDDGKPVAIAGKQKRNRGSRRNQETLPGVTLKSLDAIEQNAWDIRDGAKGDVEQSEFDIEFQELLMPLFEDKRLDEQEVAMKAKKLLDTKVVNNELKWPDGAEDPYARIRAIEEFVEQNSPSLNAFRDE